MDDTDAETNDGGIPAAANVAATSGGGIGASASDGGHMPPTATSGGLPAPPGGHLAAIGASPSTVGGGTDGAPAVPDCASATSGALGMPTSIDGATTAGMSAQFTATPFMTLGIAPGDGDLLPARFGGDSSADAEEWAQDFIDYIHIRRVPPATALLLLRSRLVGTARKWIDSLPPNLDFQETVRRFRARFGNNAATRNRIMADFWRRRQQPNEPTSQFIEDMAYLARRIHLDNDSLLVATVMNGLLPDIRRDVAILQPRTMDELTAAAAIGEASARDTATRARTNDAAVTGQLAELRLLMAQFQEMMAAHQRSGVPVQAVDRPQPTATPAAAAELPPPSNGAPVTTSTMAAPAPITVNLVMPDGGTAPHRGTRGGRGRGWGRVWRGQGRTGRPVQGHGGASQHPATNLNAAAQPFPASNGAATTGHHATATAPCANCGRAHPPDQCNAVNEPCYECHAVGHYARCCPYRLNPPNSY